MRLRTQRSADGTMRVDSNNQTRWNVILLVSAALITSSLPLHAVAQDPMTVREAAVEMMGASVFVPGIAAYCNEHVASNKPLLEAAREWNVRNKGFMEQTISTLRLNGYLSKDQKDRLDRTGYKLVKETIDGEPDPILFCTNVTNVVKSGALDLERREDLAKARSTILTVSLGSRASILAMLAWMATHCEEGIFDACFLLGEKYSNGLGGAKPDFSQAAYWYEKACDGGDAPGCTRLGGFLKLGLGVTRDDLRAVVLFQRGCDGGDAEGCAYLGTAYYTGKGIKQNIFQAVDLYRKACEGGFGHGCKQLGESYQRGEGVKQNDTAALRYYGMACDLKDEQSCYRYEKLKNAGY